MNNIERKGEQFFDDFLSQYSGSKKLWGRLVDKIQRKDKQKKLLALKKSTNGLSYDDIQSDFDF